MPIHVDERNDEMTQLRQEGVSIASLSAQYGISKQRVSQILKHHQDPTPCPNGCGRTLPLEPIYGRCCSHCDPSVTDIFNHTWQCDKRKGVLRKYYAWFDSDEKATVHRIEAPSPEKAASQLRALYPDRQAAVLVVDSTSTSLSTN